MNKNLSLYSHNFLKIFYLKMISDITLFYITPDTQYI